MKPFKVTLSALGNAGFTDFVNCCGVNKNTHSSYFTFTFLTACLLIAFTSDTHQLFDAVD